MGVRYVKDFEFPSAAGYSKSTPSKVTGQMYAKGGHVKRKYADGGGVVSPYDINQPVDQMPRDAGSGAVEGAQAGALSPQMRQKLLMLQAAKRKAMMQKQQQAEQDTRMNDVPPGANYDQGQMQRAEQGYKKGGKVKSRYAEGGIKAEQGVALPDPSPEKEMFEVYDGHTGDVVGTYGSLKRASRAVDKRDNDYGGYRYRYRPVSKAKGGKVHDDAAQDKKMIKSMIKPSALKKAAGGQAVQMAKSNAVEASLKGQKKTGYTNGGIASPLQMMGRSKGVPVAPRGPMIPQQAGPQKIGVNQARPGKPDVGAIRAAMAKKASQAMPENAPSMMKKGGKVGC
jgi:hypothetical protein